MTTNLPSPMPAFLFVLTLALLMLAPLTIAGIALMNAGLGRSRSAAQALFGNLAIIAVTAILFAVLGSAFAGSLPGGPGHILHAGDKQWNWLGTGPMLLRGLDSAPSQSQLGLIFELLSVALAALIPWGSGADRWRLAAGCSTAGILAVAIFPLAAHWIWGGGWLSQLNTLFGTGANFADPGGAATVHVLGGLCALAVIWITGPRRGKFPKEGLSTAMPGHNAAYVLFGCLVSLVGFLGWNLAGAILWMNASPATLPRTAINTLLCGSIAMTGTALANPMPASARMAGCLALSHQPHVQPLCLQPLLYSLGWYQVSPPRCWLKYLNSPCQSTIPPAQFPSTLFQDFGD
jgi:ammonium transporter, Amt family